MELESYMEQVLNLMSGQAQFNQALMTFIGFIPKENIEKGIVSPQFFDSLQF